METIITFEIAGEQYTMFVEGILKGDITVLSRAVTLVESQVPEYYNYPVAGQEILNGFSNGDPVYNMTMDDWRTHDGLDIGAEKGQNVMSIGAGTVVDSYEDIMWGNVLVIQHGDIEVRYCGLTDKSLLAAGDTVEDGQILGKIGGPFAYSDEKRRRLD